MATRTKKAIGASLLALLQEKQLNSITINEISSHCGISRKTFYYYYQDVYALIFGFLEELTERIVTEEDYDFWNIFSRVVNLIMENRTVVINVYQSVEHEILYNFLHRTMSKYSHRMILHETGGKYYPEENIDIAANVCTTGILTVILQWIHFNMIPEMDIQFLRHRKKLSGFAVTLLNQMTENSGKIQNADTKVSKQGN